MTVFDQFFQGDHPRQCLQRYTSNARRGPISGSTQDPRRIDLDAYMMHRLGKTFDGKVAMTGCHGAIGGPWLAKKTQGRDDDAQRRVGRAIRQSDASLVFLLGDNFYDDGVRTARDERFISAFRDVYIDAQSKEQQVIFAVLGNHDYKIHGFSAHGQSTAKSLLGLFQTRNYTVGRSPRETVERGYRQVAYTYEAANTMQVGGRPHPFWNMPNRYYLLYSELADFFCIDSNSYIFDTAQQAWLKQAFKDRSDVRNAKILVQHHPIVSAGHRIESRDDLKMYASAFGIGNFRDQVPEASTKPIAGGDDVLEMGWNTGYRMDQDGLDFNLIFCAHDHVLTADKLAVSDRKNWNFDRQKRLHDIEDLFDMWALKDLHYTDYDRIDAHIPAANSCTQLISGGGGASLSSERKTQHAIEIAENHRGCNQRRYWQAHGYHYVEIVADRGADEVNQSFRDHPQGFGPPPKIRSNPENVQAYLKEHRAIKDRLRLQREETEQSRQTIQRKMAARKGVGVSYFVRDANNNDIGGGAAG